MRECLDPPAETVLLVTDKTGGCVHAQILLLSVSRKIEIFIYFSSSFETDNKDKLLYKILADPDTPLAVRAMLKEQKK